MEPYHWERSLGPKVEPCSVFSPCPSCPCKRLVGAASKSEAVLGTKPIGGTDVRSPWFVRQGLVVSPNQDLLSFQLAKRQCGTGDPELDQSPAARGRCGRSEAYQQTNGMHGCKFICFRGVEACNNYRVMVGVWKVENKMWRMSA